MSQHFGNRGHILLSVSFRCSTLEDHGPEQRAQVQQLGKTRKNIDKQLQLARNEFWGKWIADMTDAAPNSQLGCS